MVGWIFPLPVDLLCLAPNGSGEPEVFASSGSDSCQTLQVSARCLSPQWKQTFFKHQSNLVKQATARISLPSFLVVPVGWLVSVKQQWNPALDGVRAPAMIVTRAIDGLSRVYLSKPRQSSYVKSGRHACRN